MRSGIENIKKVYYLLKSKKDKFYDCDYYIPSAWNSIYSENEEINVNPYDFFCNLIEKYIFKNIKSNINYYKSVYSNKEENTNGDWIKKSNIYALNVRTSTAYSHNKKTVQDGSFLKSLALIPMLKTLKVDVLYLLPIFEIGEMHKKGELGSIYSVKNFYKINNSLVDPLIAELSIEDQFSAFIEAMHILDIKIVLDIITRTVSRDSDLLYENPQWFYWIKKDSENNYKSPNIEGMYENEKPTIYNIKKVYDNENVKKHINLFCNSPDIINKEKFEHIKKVAKNKENILELIEKEFHITTAPAFSDCINDKQPPWGDITYLRLYLDNPKETKNITGKFKIPYVLFDTIKCDRFNGEIENKKLWNLIENIIPIYQKKFGIDGARIDMGHALPKRLLLNMLRRAREIDDEFAFIGEELEFNRAENIYKQGFNIMMGSAFFYEESNSEKIYELINIAKSLPIKFFAASETPDTKRTISKIGNEKLLKLLLVLNFFIPNGVPFINNGIELGESQPMNLGLGCDENDRYINLDNSHKYYGKLAFFDRYEFNWLSNKKNRLIKAIESIARIREKYINTITNINNFYNVESTNKNIVVFAYIIDNRKYKIKENILMIILNVNTNSEEYGKIYMDYMRKESWNSQVEANIIYSVNGDNEINFNNNCDIELKLEPTECKIIII